jgi:chemotaxis protein methyltransferase CheR
MSELGQQRLLDKDFERLSSFIYDHCGIKMPPAKRTMLEARLQKRLRALSIATFAGYCDYLFSREGMELELITMIDLVTTNKTDFFREPEHFTYLVGQVLPQWQAQFGNRRPFAIWSAGCSTGEEPYTMAMVLAEYAERNAGFAYSILATDISTRVLEKAHKAIYEEERVGPVPASLKRKYLLRSKDHSQGLVRIVPELRNRIHFRRLNFMDTDFGMREELDVVFCRNVVIYFDRRTQEQLVNKFCRQMRRGAYLFMGHSETLNGLDVPLVQVCPTVYRYQP